MSTNDTARDLVVVLSYLANRQIRTQEMLAALGMSRSTYYEQRDKGTLASVSNLVAAADAFGVSKVRLLVQYGHLEIDDLVDYLESEGAIEMEVDHEDDHPMRRTIRSRSRRRLRARLDVPTL